MQLQKSTTVRAFEQNVAAIEKAFPTGVVSGSGGQRKEEHVWSYLRSIHPINWAVIGNSTLSADELNWLEQNWTNAPVYGTATPLFGVRSTSGVEGDNNGLLWNRTRNNLVFRSLRAYCLRALDTRNKRRSREAVGVLRLQPI